MMKKTFSIKSIWYALMISGGLVPTIILSIMIGPRVYGFLLEDSLHHNYSINSRIAGKLNDEISRYITLLENKSDPIGYALDKKNDLKNRMQLIDKLLVRALTREGDIKSLSLVRADGSLITQVSRENNITDKSDSEIMSRGSSQEQSKDVLNKDLFRSIFLNKNEFYINYNIEKEKSSKHFSLIVAIPVAHEKQVAAILIAKLSASNIIKNIASMFVRPDYRTYFVSKQGKLLYSQLRGDQSFGSSLGDIEIVSSISKNTAWDDKKNYHGIDNEHVYGTSRLIPHVGWSVISEIPRSKILNPIYTTIVTSFLIVFAVVALFIWFGIIIAGRMIRPVNLLIDSFRKASNLDYSPSNIESSLEELNALARGYDSMVFEIKSNELSLEASKEALEKNEERFKIVTENIHEVFLIISTYWDEVIYVSPAYEDIWGMSCESLYKNPSSWSECIHPSDRTDVHLEIISLAVALKPVQFREFRIWTPDRKLKWIQANAYPVHDDRGEIISYVYVMQDVTQNQLAQLEQKKLQTQLQQSQKMEAIGQLTGGIAHDFNNMLTAIMGYTSLALDRFGKDIDPKLVEYLEEVDLAGERARDLISQLLLFSRESSSEPEAIDFAPLVKEVIRMLQTSFPKNIDIRNEMQADLPQVLMDPVRLHQLIMNLCINARDAIEGNGTITISSLFIAQYHGDCDACYKSFQGDFVELIVQDTGFGIGADTKSRIFDPFFTTKELGKGTGMGLSIVHGIVHDMGGHILVTSGPTGTAFRLFFPVIEKQEKIVEVDKKRFEHTLDGKGQHILVIDDEASVGRFEGELLDHHGYQVTVITDGEEAMAEFMDNPDKYDLVITDQSMPKITGIELAAAVLEERPNLPVILCTGYLPDLDPDEVNEIGIKEILAKPVEGDDLVRIVHKYLS